MMVSQPSHVLAVSPMRFAHTLHLKILIPDLYCAASASISFIERHNCWV